MSERPVLVTGAAGAIGRAIVGRTREPAVLGLTRDELDITDAEAVRRVFDRLRPRAVVNAAALTAVDAAELDPGPAHRVNRDGAANLARACAAHQAWLLHLSTDCVFGEGLDGRPHREDEAPAPVNVYGWSKLRGEQAIAEILPAHVILRTSWVFGPGMRGFVNAVAGALLGSGRADVVTGQIGCPTPVGDLVTAIETCVDRAASGLLEPGVYHFSSTNPIDRHALAGWMADWLSRRTGRPRAVLVPRDWRERDVARRAANAVLDVEKFQRSTGMRPPQWQPAVAQLLEDMVLAAGPRASPMP